MLYLEIDYLQTSRLQLMEKRQQLLDSWFVKFRPNMLKKIKNIEKQLDDIELQIISLQKCDRDAEIASIKK